MFDTSTCRLIALAIPLMVVSLGSANAAYQSADAKKEASPRLPIEIRVLVVKYFPTKGKNIDISVTGDWGEPLNATRRKVSKLNKEIIKSLEEGSRYHGYKDRKPKRSLLYRLVGRREFREPLPTFDEPGQKVPMTDYHRIMERVNIRKWVEEKGVKEVWLWSYDGDKVRGWESNMSSPFGDISNSNRNPNDLPVLKSTYTVYNYNYQRGASEACEDHMHQIEAVLNHVDGRDRTPPEKWDSLLFWGKFVGSDRSHKIIRPGCGWSHYPPNAEKDYDWKNKRFVETDIEDWKPDGSGKKKRLNCDRWEGDSLKWFIYWMQNLPGADNGLEYQGKPLRNWWIFIGDFDYAMKHKMTLVVDHPAEPSGKDAAVSAGEAVQ